MIAWMALLAIKATGAKDIASIHSINDTIWYVYYSVTPKIST